MLISKVKTDLIRAYKKVQKLDENMAKIIFGDMPLFRETYEDDYFFDEDEGFVNIVNKFTNLEMGYNSRMENYYISEPGVTFIKFNDPILYEAAIRYSKLCRKNRSKKKFPDKETDMLKNIYQYAYEFLIYDFCGCSEAVHASFRPYYRPTREIVLYMHSMIDFARVNECIYFLFAFIYYLKQFVIKFDKTFSKEDVA